MFSIWFAINNVQLIRKKYNLTSIPSEIAVLIPFLIAMGLEIGIYLKIIEAMLKLFA